MPSSIDVKAGAGAGAAPLLVAGVDSSTQATKALIVDAASGAVVASGRAEHEVQGTGGARETDPEAWWRALGEALRATGRAGDVAAIAVGGQQHGLVVLDARGRPVRPALLWNDTRSAHDAAALVEARGAEWWAAATGSVPVASFTVSKWAWLVRNEPAAARAAAAVCLPHDFLNGRLTGAPATDRGDASGTCWFDPVADRYREDVLGLAGVELDAALLPRVVDAGGLAGTVTPDAADAVGLRPGVPVAAGSGDNMAAALALGSHGGAPVISLGTSGTAYVTSAVATRDPSGTVAGFADAAGGFLPLACTLNCTLAVERFASLLGVDREDVAPAGEVVVLPYLDGERTPNLPAASGLVVGLRHDTPPQAILQAAYDGVAAALLDALVAIDEAGADVDPAAPLVVVGGGARGVAWRRTLARLSGRAIAVSAVDELVALGAAAQAAAACTGEQPAEVARRFGLVDEPVEPAGDADVARREQIAAALAASQTLLGGRAP
jgi:xylulokinase